MTATGTTVEAIAAAARRRPPAPHFRLYLFGSRARQTSGPRSDYDVGIEADGPLALDLIARLRDELESLPILQKIDLVDLRAVTEDFRRHALSGAKLIYEQ